MKFLLVTLGFVLVLVSIPLSAIASRDLAPGQISISDTVMLMVTVSLWLKRIGVVLFLLGAVGFALTRLKDLFDIEVPGAASGPTRPMTVPVTPSLAGSLAPALAAHPEVEAVRQQLQNALNEALAEGDERWSFDAHAALNEYLPEALQKYEAWGQHSMSDDLRQVLTQIERIGPHRGRTGEKARREWAELRTFMNEREQAMKS